MYVRVEVQPGAKKEKVENLGEMRYRMAVREPAARNLANVKVKELLCELYRVKSGQVKLVSGHRSPRKIFDVDIKNKEK